MSRSNFDQQATPMQAICAVLALGAATIAFMLTALTAMQAEENAPAGDEHVINIGNFTFNPMELKIQQGMTVTWVNGDDIGHTVASVGSRLFRSKVMDTDDKYQFTFAQPGVYEYRCTLHPNMQATITVEAKTADASGLAR